MYEFRYIPPEEHRILNEAKQVLREKGKSTTWISHMLCCGKPDLHGMLRCCLTNVEAERAREKFFLLSEDWREGIEKCKKLVRSAQYKKKRLCQKEDEIRLLEKIVEESRTPIHRKINERWLEKEKEKVKKC